MNSDELLDKIIALAVSLGKAEESDLLRTLCAAAAAPPLPPNTSVEPASSTPERITAKEVMVQMMMVSTNTSNTPHMPCSTGSLVLEAAWAMGAEPKPASLENTPRAKPWRMAVMMA